MGYDCFYSEYKSKEFKHQTPAEDNKFINFVCYAADLHKTLRLRNERKDFTATPFTFCNTSVVQFTSWIVHFNSLSTIST